MNSQTKDNKWVAVLVTILITAIIAGGGIYYWQSTTASKEKDDLQSQLDMAQGKINTLVAQSKTTVTPKPTTKVTPTPLPSSSGAAIAAPDTIVKAFYEQYPGNNTANAAAVVNTFITSDFKQRVANNDTVCNSGDTQNCQPVDMYTTAQDWPNNPTITTSTPSISGDTATVVTTIKDSSRTFTTLNVTLKLINNAWKINNVVTAS